MYSYFLLSKLKNLLQQNGLKNSIIGFYPDDEMLLNNTIFTQAFEFTVWISGAFIKMMEGDFLEKRPDLYLGRLFSLFANMLYNVDLGYITKPVNETDLLGGAILKAINKVQSVIFYLRSNNSCLARLGKSLLPQHYDTLLDVVKHSQLGNTTPTADDRAYFYKNYVEKAVNIALLQKTIPKYLESNWRLLDFCAFGSSPEMEKKSLELPNQCDLFQTTITGQGLCYTFNGRSMVDVYKTSPIVDRWNDAFKASQDVELKNPTGYGPSHGLTVVLNMFQPISLQGTFRNILVSLTNEQEWLQSIFNNFQIQPGYTHTFKVLASQIKATERFRAMSSEDRNCSFPHEVSKTSLMKNYSKGGCLFECAIRQIAQDCNCTPWNIPKNDLLNPPFCEENIDATASLSCVKNVFTSFSPKNCLCPTNCEETQFSIFDSKEPLEHPGSFCSDTAINDQKKGVYPFNILCNLCREALRLNRISFVIDYSMDVTNIDYSKFCDNFLMKNVAVIKVEMAAPRLIQSVRDKHFIYTAQISDLGDVFILFLLFDHPKIVNVKFAIFQSLSG